MKIIITEGQYNILIKESTDRMKKAINQYLNEYISEGKRKIGIKSRNYGNLREDWCVNDVESITAIYYFDDDRFDGGTLLISKSLIKDIISMFTIKKSFAIYVVEDWYEKTMIPKFESIVGESGLSINEVDISEDNACIPEPTKPEGITDEDMINFIDKNTAYRRQEIIDKIESGERDLEDFYLDIVDTVERKKRLGF